MTKKNNIKIKLFIFPHSCDWPIVKLFAEEIFAIDQYFEKFCGRNFCDKGLKSYKISSARDLFTYGIKMYALKEMMYYARQYWKFLKTKEMFESN